MLSASCFYAQQGFIKAYNFDYPTAVRFNAMLLQGDTLVTCGYVRDSFPPYQVGVFFSKIDTLGQIADAKVYYDPLGLNYVPGENPGGLIKLEDGSGYVFVGNMLEGSGGFLMKFDEAGNQVWVKTLKDTISLQGYYYKLHEVENGILIAGRKQVPSGAQNDLFLLKTDLEGNILWEKRYGQFTWGDNMQSFVKIDNDEYVIGGSHGNGLNLPWQQAHSQIQLFAVDSLGNEKWYWESDPPFDEWSIEDSGCYGLHHTDEGNWVYATTRGEFQGDPTLWRQTKFVVRDSNFNLITERTYDDVDGPTNNLYNLIQLSDGDWLGLGSSRELLPPSSPFPAHNYAWMVRISSGEDGITSLGDSLWTRLDLTFPDSPFVQLNYLHSAIELPSGSIIAAGYFTNFNPGQSDHGLLVKVNQHGCIEWDDCTPTNFPNYVSKPKENDLGLKIFPNPTSDRLHILSDERMVWDRVEILDMNGCVVKMFASNTNITVADLPSGMYVLRLWEEGRFVSRKFVVM